MQDYPCDLCGGTNLLAVDCAPRYMAGRPLHVCGDCAQVQVAHRKTPEELRQVWAEEIYRADDKVRLSDATYTARMPAVHARQTFAADFIDEAVALRGKTVCDLGAGEGRFLEMIRADDYGAEVFAVEPSAANCDLLARAGIDHFQGIAEEYLAQPDAGRHDAFDVVTIIWTLENCFSARDVMDAAWHLAKPGGHVAVATGSRILVPFKKPLQYYLGPNADAHPYHFSANSLRGYMAETGFRMTHVNRFIDSDYLVMVGEKTDRAAPIAWEKDDPQAVLDFFARWHKDTQDHFADVGGT